MLKFFSNARAKLATSAFMAVVLFFLNAAPVMAQRYDYYGNGEEAAFGVFALAYGLFWCCFAVLGIALHLGVTYYLYKDAEAKNIDSPILWALLYFFFQGIALLAYFYFNRNWKGHHVDTKAEKAVKKAVHSVKEKAEDVKESISGEDKK